MDEVTRKQIRETPVSFDMRIELYRLPAGRQIMVCSKGSRGVGITKSWDVTPGHPVTNAIVDMVTWVQKSLVEFFATWGRI